MDISLYVLSLNDLFIEEKRKQIHDLNLFYASKFGFFENIKLYLHKQNLYIFHEQLMIQIF